MTTITNRGFIFHCETDIEIWRAETMFTKEPGTIAWLDEQVGREGVCFWDIGANIGVYSLYAARLGAHVFAFEPHVGNANSLLRNAAVNKLADRITLLTVALDGRESLVPFYYRLKAAGASGSQLHQPVDEYGNRFDAVAVEQKMTLCGDSEQLALLPCNLVKIDTDGSEPFILAGMRGRLAATVRSAQVETQPKHAETIGQIMRGAGFELDRTHFTAAGQQRIDAGEDPTGIVHNAIYRNTVLT